MENRIPEEFIEEVRVRADIVEVISQYVTLQRKGKNFLGLCPFHSEKTPSFTVTPDKQIFYCFGCHVGGNVFSFLMRKENWTFLEAVGYLAEKQGMALPEKELSPHERQVQERRKRWEQIHEWAASYFHDVLLNRPEGEPGRHYFAGRGMDEATIKEFRLGYAPNRWDSLIEELKKLGVKPKELAEVGLALERHSEPSHSSNEEPKGEPGYYDRFRNRVIFSILDKRRHPIAFGGRVLDDSLPKYLNSPETTFFSKGRNLYGIHRAYTGIREQGFALLVEGYMDVIALQKAGLPNAVASLGTALTKDQAKLLKNYTQRVIIGYDSDNAGIHAALRAGEILRDLGLRVEVLTLTGAKDPDEFIKAFGVETYHEALKKATSYIEFKYKVFITQNPPQNIQDKADLVKNLAPDILKVKSPVEREGYERFLSLQLGLTLEAIQREVINQGQRIKTDNNLEYSPQKQDISVKNRDNIIRCVDKASPVATVPLGVYRAERMLLRLILEDPSRLNRLQETLDGEFWHSSVHKEIFQSLCQMQHTHLNIASLKLEDNTQSELASILVEDMDLAQPDRIFDDCIRGILSVKAEESVDQLQARMRFLEKSGDMAGAMALLREIGERLKRGEK